MTTVGATEGFDEQSGTFPLAQQEPTGAVFAKTEVVRLGEGGRFVIPAPMRDAMGIGPGDALVLQVEDGELRVLGQMEAIRRIQARVRRHVPTGASLSDELIAERRAEARKDDQDAEAWMRNTGDRQAR